MDRSPGAIEDGGVSTDAFFMWAVVTGAFGWGYVIYGWKQRRVVPLVAGIILCSFPYFVSNAWCSIAIGIVFIVLPFVVRI